MRIFGVAITALLVRVLLAGTAVDLGSAASGWSAALLAASIGCGLLSRARMPAYGDALGVTLLVPARGVLADLAYAVLPGLPVGATVMAGILSLVPLGFVLGRQLQGVVQRGGAGLLIGWGLGEIAVAVGGVGFLSGPFAGLLVAMVLALISEIENPRRQHEVPAEEARGMMAAAPVGFAAGCLVLIVQRVLPSYVEPPPGYSSEIVAAIFIPAGIIAGLVVLMAPSKRSGRVVGGVGGVALAVALLVTQQHLSVYALNTHVEMGRDLAQMTRDLGGNFPFVRDFDLWLLAMCGYGAAGLGLSAGALRGRAAGPFVFGVGVALAAEQVLSYDRTVGPVVLVLAGAGAAFFSAPLALFSKRGLFALPIVVLPFLLRPVSSQPAFDEVRRPGEFSVEAFIRSPQADGSIFSTPGPWSTAPEGRAVYSTTFTGIRSIQLDGTHARARENRGERAEDGQVAGGGLERFYGVRFAGTPLHPGHAPLGAEGSLGRLHRLFGVAGKALALGVGAELIASDLKDGGFAGDVVVSTPMRDTDSQEYRRQLLILFDLLGSSGFDGPIHGDPIATSRTAWREGPYAMVVVAPERPQWSWEAALLTTELLERLKNTLSPNGRCLAWLDTTDMDERELRSRLASFGEVFGAKSLAVVEMREVDAPFVLLIGWRNDEGQPRKEELLERLPSGWTSGRRSRLSNLDDLSAMLLADGPTLAAMAEEGPTHSRIRPIPAGRGGLDGWASLAAVAREGVSLGLSIRGAPDGTHHLAPAARAFSFHQRYSYHINAVNQIAGGVLGDIDWAAWRSEVDRYTALLEKDPDHPLLHLATAALAEPLVLAREFGRFTELAGDLKIEAMDSWRLALLEGAAREQVTDVEGAEKARARAKRLAESP